MKLTEKQLQEFHENGFLVIKDFFEPEALIQETRQLIDQFDSSDTVFKTGDDDHVGNEYFLESGDKIRYFLEDLSESSMGTTSISRNGSTKVINKIGHCLHELNPVFSKFTKQQAIIDIGSSLFEDCRILQSMLILKQPLVGSSVPPHQDSTFLFTNPPSCVGLWFALENSTEDNGVMSFAPGSHKSIVINSLSVV